MNRGTGRIQDINERQEKELKKLNKGVKRIRVDKSGEKKEDKRGSGIRLEVKKSPRDSPNGSILRPTGADGGRLGPSIIGGGDGAPPLTGEGPYESPVPIRPAFIQVKVALVLLKSEQTLFPL